MSKYLVNIKNKKIFNGEIPRYEVLKPIVLYEKKAGTTANFTLKENISNFKYLEIFFRSHDDFYSSRKIYHNNASSIKFDLTSDNFVTNTVLYIKSTVYSITNKNVSVSGYGQLGINTTDITHTNKNLIYITKVFGYK